MVPIKIKLIERRLKDGRSQWKWQVHTKDGPLEVEDGWRYRYDCNRWMVSYRAAENDARDCVDVSGGFFVKGRRAIVERNYWTPKKGKENGKGNTKSV